MSQGGATGNLAAGLDIGSYETRCVVLERRGPSAVLRGASVVRSQGWDAGRIINATAVSEVVQAAALSASIRSGVELKTVTVGYADSFVQMEELAGILRSGGLRAGDYVAESEAALLATTTDLMRQGGICLADIGKNASEMAFVEARAGLRTGTLASGGDAFTKDLAEQMELPFGEAESFKVRHGRLCQAGNPPTSPLQKELSGRAEEILEARAGQYFHALAFHLEQLRGSPVMGTGLILAGGGASLPGLCEFAEACLDIPVRLGQVIGIQDWPLELSSPAWATVAGLALHAAQNSSPAAGGNAYGQ